MTNSRTALPVRFDKYELLERLGHGGMAEVFRARMPGVAGFAKIVGIKKLLPHLLDDSHAVALFVNEAKIAAEVQHRNIVQVFELGQAATGEYFIAMEYIEGTDLRRVLQQAVRLGRRIPPWFSIFVISEVLAGLAHAHALRDATGRPRNIVHRDVTPSNVFLSRQGDVKLSDFGVAHDESRDPLTTTGAQKGKAGYMSPEQVRGDRIDARTDVFAAGTVLWECLTQKRLFGGRSDPDAMFRICYCERRPPSAFVPEIPAALDELVLRAVAVDPATRPGSAREFREALLQILHGLRERVYAHDVSDQLAALVDATAPPPPESPAFDGPAGTAAPSQATSRLTPSLSSEVDLGLTPLPAFTPVPLTSDEAVTEAPPLHELSLEDALPDVEQLVSQAVEEAVLELPRVPAGLSREPPPPLELDAIPEAVVPGLNTVPLKTSYDGPHPFWVRTHDGREVGPLHWRDAWQGLKVEALVGELITVAISSDRVRWLAAHHFGELTGTDFLRPPIHSDASTGRSTSGTIGRVSVVALFHRLHAERFTGWLVVSNPELGEEQRREVRWNDGLPSQVRCPIEELQDMALYVSKRLIPADKWPEVMSRVLREGKPIGAVAGHLAHTELAPYQAIFTKERLEDVFRWRRARYTARPDTSKRKDRPLSFSIYSLLLDMTIRARTPDELRDALRPHLEVTFGRAERFASAIASMRMTEAQLDLVRNFGSRTLGASLRTPSREKRFAYALAYVLIETELLVPKT